MESEHENGTMPTIQYNADNDNGSTPNSSTRISEPIHLERIAIINKSLSRSSSSTSLIPFGLCVLSDALRFRASV